MAEQVVQNQVGFAPQIAPYAETLLGQAQALTDTTKNPYQTYSDWAQSQGLSGDQIAQFSDLQKKAFAGGENLGYDPASVMSASGLAGLATQAGSTSYTPNQFQTDQFGQPQAQQYMSPYMQSVVEAQQRDAQRQAEIATTQRNAQATGQGAFGGSRQAIMDSEAARNLAIQKGDIQAAGLQKAYDQAAQQFNLDQARGLDTQKATEQSRQFGSNLGLQGLQTGLQGYSALGSQGQNLYGQNTGNINLQNLLGGQQQQQAQNMINTNIQDFSNMQNYPYKQLGFMSDIIRGAPVSQVGQTVYQPPPSALSTAAGLASIYKGMTSKAKGGTIRQSYKNGGLVQLALASM